jgi:type IV secretory pathway VirB10-like protein
MKKLFWTLTIAAVLVLCAGTAQQARADKHATNACGCYTVNNNCFCEKKAKCGCPGECEPRGCEAERQKQLQKEIEEETRKAKEEEKEKASQAKDAGKPAAGESAPGEKSADGKEPAAAKAAKIPPGKRMTEKQKKQLAKLMDAYMAENPDAATRSMSDVREDLD